MGWHGQVYSLARVCPAADIHSNTKTPPASHRLAAARIWKNQLTHDATAAASPSSIAPTPTPASPDIPTIPSHSPRRRVRLQFLFRLCASAREETSPSSPPQPG